MATFCSSVFALVLIVLLVHSVNAESVRHRIFGDVEDHCSFEQFRCQNGNCIPRDHHCNGGNDCEDNSDELHCSMGRNECPTDEQFSCRSRNDYNYYYKCIPKSWRCDGFADCHYGEDEAFCKDDIDILQPTYLRKKKFWPDEIAYELSLDLLSRLALKKIENVSSTELAAYINAFLVTCMDPKKFYALDLVSELRKRVDAQNDTNPSVLLALCNAGERITERDVQKLLNLFEKAHTEFKKSGDCDVMCKKAYHVGHIDSRVFKYELLTFSHLRYHSPQVPYTGPDFHIDTQAFAILALTCASKQPYEAYDLEEIRELTMELKKRQYRNGMVENLKTTALVMQALLAAESEADEENFDEEKAVKQILLTQMADGSFGSIVNTYYVLPVLGRKSLVNISSSHCTPAVVDENDAIKNLMNQVGEKWHIQISLWIGNNRTVERILALSVPANTSLYRVMEFAAAVDNKYKFEYSMRNGKPFIYSISGFQDDPENEMLWFLFTSKGEMKEELQPTTKSESEWNPSMVYS
ncbi:uncharacterized protein CDAR_493451 [Caerostris darwini]|uniref:Vitellogenin receptor n=1 Tax=Caerostris darwini TaxID=1538125 RepID=A0AAV4QSF5_9ARAC|nr:uncharacterized protein CDAR_493451 [Caerostris darwini]